MTKDFSAAERSQLAQAERAKALAEAQELARKKDLPYPEQPQPGERRGVYPRYGGPSILCMEKNNSWSVTLTNKDQYELLDMYLMITTCVIQRLLMGPRGSMDFAMCAIHTAQEEAFRRIMEGGTQMAEGERDTFRILKNEHKEDTPTDEI